MKTGKEPIYTLPMNDITNLGALAQRMEQEARARGVQLPPPVRLQIGEPSFRTPEHICRAAVASIESETQTYGPPAGWPWLRELIAAKIARVNGYSVTPDNAAIAVGGTGAILSALTATVGPGDEVLMPDPHWPHYTMQLACCGATAVPYALDAHNGWLPDVRQLEQLVTPRTRMLIINSPGNPTGAVFAPELIADLLDFARRHDLYLLSDECYDEIVFEGQHVSPASLLSRDEFNDGRLDRYLHFLQNLCHDRLARRLPRCRDGDHEDARQRAGCQLYQCQHCYTARSAAALTGPQDCVAEMRETYRRRRDLAVSLLKAT